MYSVRRIGPTNLGTVAAFTVGTDAPGYVVEVERFASTVAADSIRFGRPMVWEIDHGSTPVAIFAHCPHEHFATELLQAVVVRRDLRGRGHGEAVLRLAAVTALEHSVHDDVVWLVHPDHVVMQTLSARVTTDPAVVVVGGYLMYAYP